MEGIMKPEPVAGEGRGELQRDLEALVPGGVYRDVPLSRVSRWRVGGPARLVVAPGTISQVQRVMAYVSSRGLPYVVLGSSTNLLFADEGLEVLAIHIGARLGGFRVEGNRVWSEAGIWVPAFARQLARAGLSGAEHTCGIPGTLGGLICMNGGSQRRGIGDRVIDVTSVTKTGEKRVRTREECGFQYRRSIFQGLGEIIVGARFRFVAGPSPSSVRKEMLTILGERRRKFPRKVPNCGSVFVSNPAMYAQYGPPGAVIERCGLKGMRLGGAMISPLHANFIVNQDQARAADILALIGVARRTVLERTGYDMAAEVCYVSPIGKITPAHLKAESLCVPESVSEVNGADPKPVPGLNQ